MTLDQWVSQHSSSELARRLKVTPAMIYHWRRGLRRVSAEKAIEIERVTDGQVLRTELRPDIQW